MSKPQHSPARGSVTLPANVQYAWPHPSRRYFYVVSSNGQPGGGDAPRGDDAPAQRVPHRSREAARLHPTAKLELCRRGRSTRAWIRAGQFVLTAFNEPSSVTVHRINADGTLGQIRQSADEARYRNLCASDPRRAVEPFASIVIARGNNATRRKLRIQARSTCSVSTTASCRRFRSVEARHTVSASVRAISISIRRSRGSTSRSSGRTRSTSTTCSRDGKLAHDAANS